jgi:cell division septum initiation protein DivIVA
MSPGKRRDVSEQHRALRTDTAQRLEAIVEAAERAAEGVIDDAEKQARSYLAEARERADREAAERLSALDGMTDSLLGEAATLRRAAERLQAALEDAKARIEVERPNQDSPRLRAVEPVGETTPVAAVPHAESPRPEGRRTDAAGARLLATQMAVSGSSREEIEARLRNGFKIEDTAGILDAILGPED